MQISNLNFNSGAEFSFFFALFRRRNQFGDETSLYIYTTYFLTLFGLTSVVGSLVVVAGTLFSKIITGSQICSVLILHCKVSADDIVTYVFAIVNSV